MNSAAVAIAIMVLSCGVMMVYSGKTKLIVLFTNKILLLKLFLWRKV